MIVAIDFVDEGNARFRITMRAGYDAVPDVRSISHAGSRRLFNQSVRKIGGFECFFFAGRHSRAVGPSIHNISAPRDWIENPLRPRLALEFKLIPFVVIAGLAKLVPHIYRKIEI